MMMYPPHQVRHKVEFSIFMWLLFASHVLIFLVLLVSAALVEMRPVSDLVTYGMHPYTGFFGFLSKEQIFSVRPAMMICTHSITKQVPPRLMLH